jgi:hypothetical protein
LIEQLQKYGVELASALSPETLITLREQYETKVASLQTKQDAATAEGESLLKQTLALVTTEENVEQVSLVRTVLADAIWSAVEENEALSPLFVEMLQSLKQEMMDERDFQIGRIRQTLKPTARPADEEFVSAKDDAETLGELIRALFVLLRDSLPKTKEFAEAFPLKERTIAPATEGGERIGTGEFLPKLTKLPKTPGEVTATKSTSANRQLRYSWNGEEVPAGKKLADVAHDYVSDGKTGFVVDVRGIQDALKKTEQEMFGETPWKLTFPTGELVGWLPAKK